MKRPTLLLATLALVSVPLLAADIDPKLDRAARAVFPQCADAKITWHELDLKLPPRFTGALAKVESGSQTCQGQVPGIISPSGGVYFGSPWPIGSEQGATIEEKVKNFTWRNLQENMTVTVEKKPTLDGLLPVTLNSMTEAGIMPMQGVVDPQGQVFFFGTFRRLAGDLTAERAAALARYVDAAPSKGAAGAKITLVEFSDFQCPSCRRSSTFADTLLARFGDKVRYVRYDVPLSDHAWAFAATMAGRAVYRQKPELFWEYKKNVYDNQDSLNAFMFWDWARAWAEDHGLDLARYDADLSSADVKKLILEGTGAAFSNDIRATPTFMVNGTIVEFGEEGKALTAYVEGLLKER